MTTDALLHPPHLSLVLPVYRGADFVVENTRHVVAALERTGRRFEVLVICDGCPATARAAARLEDDRIRVLAYDRNEGKGYAVCYGMAHARGRLIGWLDADLDIDPDVIVAAVERFQHANVDAVVGSKRHPESAVHYPVLRRVYSWSFQLLIRALLRVSVRDTQVGAKVLRREMVDTVLPLVLIKRYAFDLELLAVGAEFGFDRVEEVPIRLSYRFSGTGINLQAVRHMFQDTLAIGYRIHLRHWYVRQFAALQRARGDLAAAGQTGLLEHLPPTPAGTLSAIRERLA